MTIKNFTREITVLNTPSAAYKALTLEFDKWWTFNSNPITAVGEIVTFRFDDTYWTMRAINLLPDKYVHLKCIEAHHIHDGLPLSILKEWQGTELKWEIQPQGKNTKITLIHEGLVPSLNCYGICEDGWEFFFVKSLKDYLDDGEGSPYKSGG